ncbi:hypothetical protein GAO09_11250 [Rhizobiales bacterium RZME27]|jgi:hypothetical protein|uniref:Uncharacterized protein n=1 Tax=Endobacterium cereale TaxID=2663029 RepID=A0A6A8A9M8_9HYPH|nr:hypothetical protein [Endobacterium cereale]
MDMYQAGGEAAFKTHIKRIEEAAVDSIYTDLRLRRTDEWTEVLVQHGAASKFESEAKKRCSWWPGGILPESRKTAHCQQFI